jgi:hypothetical protein
MFAQRKEERKKEKRINKQSKFKRVVSRECVWAKEKIK